MKNRTQWLLMILSLTSVLLTVHVTNSIVSSEAAFANVSADDRQAQRKAPPANNNNTYRCKNCRHPHKNGNGR